MKLARLVSPVAGFLVLLGIVSSAEAQSSAAASQQLFQDGAALLKAGKVHEACLKFTESQKLEPQLGTLLNMASCHEREGRIATAWSEYSELSVVAQKKGDQKRATYATTKVTELEKQLPRLLLEVPAGTTELTVDGAALGQAGWGVALPMDAGDHVVTYGAPAKKSGALHVSTTNGQTTKTTLPALEDQAMIPPQAAATTEPKPQIKPPEPPPPPVQEPAAEEPAGRPPMRTAGYVTGAVGVVGLGVGGVFGALALGAKGDVTKNCDGPFCSRAGLDAVDNARRDATISTVSFIAGGVCLAAGITMVLLSGKKTARAGLVPVMNGDGGGLVGVGTF